MSALLALALQAATASGTYDCAVDPPRALDETSGALNPIQTPFPAGDAWHFRVGVVENDGGITAEVQWAQDPIQIAGSYPALPTAEGSLAFAAYHQAPCLFTESLCMTLVHLTHWSPTTANIVILPSALATNRAQNTREPFVVVIRGTCSRAGASR